MIGRVDLGEGMDVDLVAVDYQHHFCVGGDVGFSGIKGKV